MSTDPTASDANALDPTAPPASFDPAATTPMVSPPPPAPPVTPSSAAGPWAAAPSTSTPPPAAPWGSTPSSPSLPPAPPPAAPPAYGQPAPYGQQPSYAAPPAYGGAVYSGIEHPQGTLILILGILSIVICGVTGPFAWSMGRKALREIDASGQPYSNRGQVQAGMITGIVGSVFLLLGILYLVFVVFIFGMAATSGAIR
jgi:hypothetical protein